MMKKYKTIVSPRAKKDIKRYVSYLVNVKKSQQAAQALYDDYRGTIKRLADVAGMLRDPDSEELRKRELKRINFTKHNYFLLYRIKGEVVEIVAMFHGLEDYENKL